MFALARFALAPVAAAPSRQEVKRLKLGKTPEGILPAPAVATGVAPDGAHADVAMARDNPVAIVDLKPLEATGHLSSGSGVGVRYSVGMAWVERR